MARRERPTDALPASERPTLPALPCVTIADAPDEERDLAERIGDLERPARLAMQLDRLVGEPLDTRAGFLLANVDGAMTFADLLDLGGMPRVDAMRVLCALVARGVLR